MTGTDAAKDSHLNELDVRVILQHDKRTIRSQEAAQSGHCFETLDVEEASTRVCLMHVSRKRDVVVQDQVDAVRVHPLVPDIDVQETDVLPIGRKLLIR